MEMLRNFPKLLWLFRSETKSKWGTAGPVLLATLPTAFLSSSTSTTAIGSDGMYLHQIKDSPQGLFQAHPRH